MTKLLALENVAVNSWATTECGIILAANLAANAVLLIVVKLVFLSCCKRVVWTMVVMCLNNEECLLALHHTIYLR